MFIKKRCFILIAVLFIINAYVVSAVAARTGEVETGFVEFTAMTPDDFSGPIEIQLTHKQEQYVLKYYLYHTNNYFSNESVPCGDYSVDIIIGGDEDYGFIHDENLVVKKGNFATPFTITVDYLSLEGDVSDEDLLFYDEIVEIQGPEQEQEPEPDESKETTDIPDELEIKESSSSKSGRNLFVSLLVSVLSILVVGIILWFFKNR